MFKKFLDPRSDRRPRNFQELNKFLDDRWLAKGAEKDMAENEPDELCPSMYSFHSSPEEKNKLLFELAQAGIETTVDRVAKKTRIRDWIEASIIAEEDEEDDSSSATPSSSVSRTPVSGHISSIKVSEQSTTINTTIKDASRKHLDPRTGNRQIGPSEMVKPVPDGEATRSNSSADSLGKSGSEQNGINQSKPPPFPEKISNVQKMVNAKMEFPVQKSNDNNIRYYNESYDFSSQSVVKEPLHIVGDSKARNNESFNSSVNRNSNFKKIDSGYGSTEMVTSSNQQQQQLLRVFRPNSKSNSDDSGSFHSDDRGSIGFVNFAGPSRKDSPYDYVKAPKK